MNFEFIKSIDDLEKASREVVWQNFERLAAFIFEENDFRVEVNVVKTLNKRRRQYDVIARKEGRTYLAECKKWSGNRYRLSQLKKAIEKHIERSEFYRDLTDEAPIWTAPLRVDNGLSNNAQWRGAHEEDEAALRP